jgi:hypothetical protein
MSEVREFVDRASRRRKPDLATLGFGVPVEPLFVIKTNFSRDRGFMCWNSECFCKR